MRVRMALVQATLMWMILLFKILIFWECILTLEIGVFLWNGSDSSIPFSHSLSFDLFIVYLCVLFFVSAYFVIVFTFVSFSLLVFVLAYFSIVRLSRAPYLYDSHLTAKGALRLDSLPLHERADHDVEQPIGLHLKVLKEISLLLMKLSIFCFYFPPLTFTTVSVSSSLYVVVLKCFNEARIFSSSNNILACFQINGCESQATPLPQYHYTRKLNHLLVILHIYLILI